MTTIGFLGLGIMGKAMASNLVKAGFNVTVWNRNPAKCDELVLQGAHLGTSPKDVTKHCDITFAMVSDPDAALALCQGPDGVLAGIGSGRGYVDMSTVDNTTSKAISNLITQAGGRFLEAPVSGTKKPAEDGTLIILAAGDASLYEETKSAFDVMGKMSPYLGDVGQGANMKLVVNMMMGGMLSIFSEGMSLGQKAGLNGNQILEIIDAGAIANSMFKGKGAMLLKEDYSTSFPLKQAIKAGFADEDIVAVYKVIK